MFAKNPKFTYIGEKTFEIGKHVIVTDEYCSTSEFNENIQISMPEGYEPKSYSYCVDTKPDNTITSYEKVMFSNIEPVIAKGYKHIKTGEELYPEFGKPIQKIKTFDKVSTR